MTKEHACTNVTAHDPGYISRPADLGTLDGRIEVFCKWFDVEPPTLTRDEGGEVLVSDEFLGWHKENGVSIDWIAVGDPKCMASVFRRERRKEREFRSIIAQMDEVEKGMLKVAMKSTVDGLTNMDDAIGVLHEALAEHRATLQTKVT